MRPMRPLYKSGFFRNELCRVGRNKTVTAVVLTFIVGEDTEVRRESEEFVLCQAELPSPRMVMPEIIIDDKRFVDQDAIRFQCLHQPWEEWPMKIEEYHDHIIGVLGKFRSVVGRTLQIDRMHAQARKVPLFCQCRESNQSLFIAVQRIDLETM